MLSHLRANLLLLALTVAICCVMYPLVLLGIAAVMPDQATGSMIADAATIRGSRLIAQPFTADEYFWPRPSAAGYNGTASSGSNLGASSPKLRDRVAQQLGPLVQYKAGSASAGSTPQKDMEAWFAAKPNRAADWAGEFDVAVGNWAKTDYAAKTDAAEEKYGLQGEYIQQWAKDHPDVIEEWKKANPTKTDDPKPEELAAFFFTSFAKAHPGKFPAVVEFDQPDKTKAKRIEPVSWDAAMVPLFFELWLRDPANASRAADLEPVPADMVMASGSGLDPHITLRNALCIYQLDRVAAKRTPSGGDVENTKQGIAALARRNSFTPLSGLLGEPLVNVLVLNLELDKQFPVPPAKAP